jgi:hypothetical protein
LIFGHHPMILIALMVTKTHFQSPKFWFPSNNLDFSYGGQKNSITYNRATETIFNQQQLLFLVVGNWNFSSTYNRPTKTIFPLTIIIIFNHWQSNFPLPLVTTHRPWQAFQKHITCPLSNTSYIIGWNITKPPWCTPTQFCGLKFNRIKIIMLK